MPANASLTPRCSALAYLWAAPCTAFGLAMVVLWWALGARPRWHQGVLESVVPSGRHAWLLRRLPFVAITLGHTVLAVGDEVLPRLRCHERAHVRQYEQWGAFFLLAYPLASMIAVCAGRGLYRGNWFERQACQAQSAADATNA